MSDEPREIGHEVPEVPACEDCGEHHEGYSECPARPQGSGQRPQCEFVRGEGKKPYCERPADPVEMYDGGIVHVCGYHRPWVVALARVEAHGG